MKPRTLRILAGALACFWALAPLPRGGKAVAAAAPESASPTPAGKGEGKKKKNREAGAPAASPAGSKDGGAISLPLPIGLPTSHLRIPDMDAAGKVLSVLMAQKATRIDEDRVQMEEMRLDLNKPDGKEDFHIVMPASIFNLKTHIIYSDDPVTVRTQDFELTGEKMEFNTVEREGRLIGHVRMVVHNLKQMAGSPESTPKTE